MGIGGFFLARISADLIYSLYIPVSAVNHIISRKSIAVRADIFNRGHPGDREEGM